MLLASKKRLMVPAAAVVLAAASVMVAACGGAGSDSSSGTAPTTAPGSGTSSPATARPIFSNPPKIDNRYLPLTATRQCTFRGGDTDGTQTRAVRTVLDRVKRFTVAGRPVDTAVIADRAYKDGKHVETALDYYAQADDGTVHYFGEDVRNLKNGRVINTKGSWLYGKHTDALGVAMPAHPRVVGAQWRIEDVPGVTAESNRLEETGLRTTAAGRVFTDAIRVQAFIQPEGEVEYTVFAPGVGPIAVYSPDGRSELVGCR